MSFLTVTTDESGTIEIDFGVYYSMGVVSFTKAYYARNYITKAHMMDGFILVWGTDIRTFDVIAPGGDNTKGLIVDSFNGVTPTDLDHLFSLIKGIM
jgi:hypothetical protein